MLELFLLLLIAVCASIYVGRVAPERGRSTSAWMFWAVLGTVLGFMIGSLGLAQGVQSGSAPATLVLVLNPILLACLPPIGVIVLLHALPVAAMRLRGTSWELDRVDADDERLVLSLNGGVRVSSKRGEVIVRAADIQRHYADGECLVLDCGAPIGKLVLRPTGLASRETRMRFVEALCDRIRSR